MVSNTDALEKIQALDGKYLRIFLLELSHYPNVDLSGFQLLYTFPLT